MSGFRGELTKLIARALETFRPPAASIAGQLAGAQVAPASSGSPGVVDPDAFEPALGDPAADGHILSSTVAGLRSWVAPGGGSDPTTTEGDLIYRGPVSVTRLGIGSAGDVLQVVGGVPAWAAVTWSQITGKPSTFTPAAHTHVGADVTDLSEAVQDIVGAAIKAGAANVTVSYNDATGETTISVAIPSASDLTAGTLADARLSSNVPLKNITNIFTTKQRITGATDNTGALLLEIYGNTTLRSSIDDGGTQVWYLGAAGSLGYSTPGGRVGMVLRDDTGASRSDIRHISGGGFGFYSSAGSGAPALIGTMDSANGVDVTPKINTAAHYAVDGAQVLSNRRTGWSAATGTATRTAFATSTVTTAQLAERVKALIDDLLAHGVIGT
jgi:hypothetical protein